MKVPSGGIMLGYFFAACAAFSSADSCGPGYLGASLRSLAPWEGGLNFAGFSRTSGLEGFDGLELFFELFDALRMNKEGLVGWETCVRHIVPARGNRNRGIVLLEAILRDVNKFKSLPFKICFVVHEACKLSRIVQWPSEAPEPCSKPAPVKSAAPATIIFPKPAFSVRPDQSSNQIAHIRGCKAKCGWCTLTPEISQCH